MRKILTALGAGALCLLCFFCVRGGGVSCAERADRMVSGWDRAALNLYRYTGRGLELDGCEGYMLVMTPETAMFASEQALREYQEYATVCQCVAAVYPSLAECFASAQGETRIVIAVCGGDGQTRFTFLNGELSPCFS